MADESRRAAAPPATPDAPRAGTPPMPGAPSVTSAPVARRDPRRWFGDGYAPDPALLARGETNVRVGVATMLAGLVGTALAMTGLEGAVVTGNPLVALASGVLWQSLVAAGILASSRVARVIGVAQSGLMLISTFALTVVALRHGGFDTSMGRSGLLVAAGMALMIAGTTLATVSPAARAWHAVQHAARAARRKAKSLAEWRQPAP